MKLKLKAKESSVPKLLIKTKPPKGGKGGNYKTSGQLNYQTLAIWFRMRSRIFTKPFIVRLLSEGKPKINTVPLD